MDDEQVVRDTLRLFLEGRGCRVVVAEDGVEGLEAVREDLFDLVVADVRMPRRDGIWLWHEATNARPELAGRFVFVSSAPLPQNDGDSGREQFLPKPFRLDQLWKVVSEIAERPLP